MSRLPTKEDIEVAEEHISVIEASNDEETNSENGEDEEDSDDEEETNDGIPIDLSQNEVYRGICTLFEDNDGNNILEYISLLHTELIGINKSLENLKYLRKDISRMADAAESFFLKNKSGEGDTKKEDVSTSKSRHRSK